MSADSALPGHVLLPHPSTPPGAVRDIGVSVRRDGNQLVLRYRLAGELDKLLLPPPREPALADELWRHTCFEAFVGSTASSEYVEYNFSPSGEWAAYHFGGYRAAMRPHKHGSAPTFITRVGLDVFELTGTVDIRWLASSPGGTIRLGVTAVIEDRGGGLSYWALKHVAEKPDFHHADSFIIDVH